MDSSASLDQHAKSVPKQCDTFLLAGKYPSSRRTPSFSSCSSSLSPSSSSLDSFYIFPDDPLLSPASPLRFSGVPFSWEHLPGIPKKQNSNKKKESSMKLLPLPPPTTTTTHTQSSKNSVMKIPGFGRRIQFKVAFKKILFLLQWLNAQRMIIMKKKQVAVSGMELRCQQGALVIVLGLLASTLLAREPVLFLNHWFTFQAQEEAPMNMLLTGPSEHSSALH